MLGSHGEGYFTSRRDGETEGVGGGGRRVCVYGSGEGNMEMGIYMIFLLKVCSSARPPSLNQDLTLSKSMWAPSAGSSIHDINSFMLHSPANNPDLQHVKLWVWLHSQVKPTWTVSPCH